MTRTPLRLFVLALAATLAALVLPGTAQAAPYCGITWGSLVKQAGNSAPALRGTELTGVRAGQHTCYDRLVLDLTRAGEGYRVRYVTAVRDQGRGAVVPLRGGAFIQVDDQSQATTRPAMPSVAGYTTFRQVAWGGSFEGYTTIGLGVRARLPFRVFRSTNHLVIDVAHHW